MIKMKSRVNSFQVDGAKALMDCVASGLGLDTDAANQVDFVGRRPTSARRHNDTAATR